jgi:hypothetical protein
LEMPNPKFAHPFYALLKKDVAWRWNEEV